MNLYILIPALISLLAVGGGSLYAVFRRGRTPDAAPGPDTGTPRRFYCYFLSFVALALLASGVTIIQMSLLDELFGEPALHRSATRLATGLALTLVGLPLWFVHWRLAQRSATRSPASAGRCSGRSTSTPSRAWRSGFWRPTASGRWSRCCCGTASRRSRGRRCWCGRRCGPTTGAPSHATGRSRRGRPSASAGCICTWPRASASSCSPRASDAWSPSPCRRGTGRRSRPMSSPRVTPDCGGRQCGRRWR